ncbi:Hypothetical predicted protein [Xyrichtys novacula]|uniref:Uncharacterized protein n=1 Tax=Xyrichtys novacula TaxID=13765 RepID=A0AAV1GY94_XYRNO|nr:Hypothetical predicted protein [Xyrichtys novacula]
MYNILLNLQIHRLESLEPADPPVGVFFFFFFSCLLSKNRDASGGRRWTEDRVQDELGLFMRETGGCPTEDKLSTSSAVNSVNSRLIMVLDQHGGPTVNKTRVKFLRLFVAHEAIMTDRPQQQNDRNDRALDSEQEEQVISPSWRRRPPALRSSFESRSMEVPVLRSPQQTPSSDLKFSVSNSY